MTTRLTRLARFLPWLSLAAALALTAQAEWTLALAVGWHRWVAWCAPLALDAYVVAAFRAGKDRAYALSLMAAAVFAAHAVPVAFPAGLPWWIAGVCSVIPPVVAWRVHEIELLGRARMPHAQPRRETTRQPAGGAAAPGIAATGQPSKPPTLHSVDDDGKPAAVAGVDGRYLTAARALKASGKKVTRRALLDIVGGGTDPANDALQRLKAAGEA